MAQNDTICQFSAAHKIKSALECCMPISNTIYNCN